jgi:hypothetical protein
MLSNICYGTAALNYGNLTLTARAGGKRGEAVTLTVTINGALAVNVTIAGPGAGDIVVTAPDGTTEAELLASLNDNALFRKLASVEQTGGLNQVQLNEGTDIIAALAKTHFDAATGGLRQTLQTRTGITIWEDRDMKASGAAVALLWPSEAKITHESPEVGGFDKWEGTLMAGIAFQQDVDFESQNVTLDLFRRALYLATKIFTHDDLIDIGPASFGYGNTNKDEVAGTVLDHARLKVVGSFPIKWRELAFDPDDADEFPFDHFKVALWREPVDDTPGPGGGEVLDTELTIEE